MLDRIKILCRREERSWFEKRWYWQTYSTYWF